MVFALASALRLARFNASIDEEKPLWQANYFTGMPAPAAAIVVLLPLYLEQIGASVIGKAPLMAFTIVYTLLIAGLMVSTIPTFSGKLLGGRVSREWVLPLFVLVLALVALLVTYPYPTLTGVTLAYLATIPYSVRRYSLKLDEAEAHEASAPPATIATPALDRKPDDSAGGDAASVRQ